ncbi:MAG: hypothetical protein Q8O19_05125, partial [Rectinemataceae bacterium]|nr:hypothetical protein [Rectinemataceae bacterium]
NRTASKTGRNYDEIIRKYIARGCKGGPMHYPTHSTCGPVCVMNAHAEKVTAYGYRNSTGDPYFANDEFSNEMALFKMSNGAIVRIAEMRESPGMPGNTEETFRIMGTTGSYSENCWFEIKRPDFAKIDLKNLPKPERTVLADKEMRDPLPLDVQNAFKQAMNKNVKKEDIQNLDFNPAGHGGSHPYLVHEFVDAIAHNRQPAINIWEASRYMAMGVMAHKSALKDGETLDVPDWGNAPNGVKLK